MGSALGLGAGPAARPFALDEVHAAVRALQAGEFRNARPTARPADQVATGSPADPKVDAGTRKARARIHADVTEWTPQPGERVLAVIGSSGSSGASTVALAVALSAAVPVRVVECCSASASGLAAATTAELGLHPTGWRQGRREQVLIERVSEVLAGVDELPTPTTFQPGAEPGAEPGTESGADRVARLTVLDIGWEVGQLTSTDSWAADAVARADQVLLVTTATVPGFRRLEGALELLATHTGVQDDRVWVAMVGPRRKKWPRGLEHAGGPQTRHALRSDRLLEIPEDRVLAIHGLNSRPVPPALIAAAAVAHTTGTSTGVAQDVGRGGLGVDVPPDQLDLFADTDQPTDQPTGQAL